MVNAINYRIIQQVDELTCILEKSCRQDLYGPADFWKVLGEKHKELIRRQGIEQFKRTINFEYHQWEVRSIADAKIALLLQQLLRRGKIPYGPLLTRISHSDLDSIQEVCPYSYAIFMGLLWQFALLTDQLGCLKCCHEPTFGNPLAVMYCGSLISQDLATSSIELNRIAHELDVDKIRKISEIGSGYGRLAYMVYNRFPDKEYCMFDIPPALVIAQYYLAVTCGEHSVAIYQPDNLLFLKPRTETRIRAFLPHELEKFPDGYFDLMINILLTRCHVIKYLITLN